jgi:hypothetical protein
VDGLLAYAALVGGEDPLKEPRKPGESRCRAARILKFQPGPGNPCWSRNQASVLFATPATELARESRGLAHAPRL